MASLQGISVVIPNYNGKDLLPQVLPCAVAALENTGLIYEIIVVDDASQDDSIAVLQKEFSKVKVLQNEQNSGFSVTANKGIYAAQFDWVLLLNSDVKLEPGYFAALLKYTTYPGLFAVMGRIIGWNDEIIQDGAKYPFFHGVKIKTSGNYLLKDEASMKDGLLSMYVSGANMFLNKTVFIKIGGFNEMFSPFYVEDFELSLRAWRLGYTCYYEHFAVCRHRTSTTIASSHKKKKVNIIYNRNKMYLHAIHLEAPKRYVWFLQLFAEAFFRLLTFNTGYARSVSLFLGHYREVRRKRNEIKKLAQPGKPASVKEIADTIKSKLDEQNIIRF